MAELASGNSVYFWWGWRRIGRPFAGRADKPNKIFSFSSTVSNLNLVTTLWINTSISSRAYSLPTHIRGPPPKGTKVYGSGPFPSNLDGSNFSGLGKYLGFLCVECTHQCVCNKTKYAILVSQSHNHIIQSSSKALNQKEPYVYIFITYLPSLWNGKTCKREVSCGFSKSSLGRGCKPHWFPCYTPSIFHLLDVTPIQKLTWTFGLCYFHLLYSHRKNQF